MGHYTPTGDCHLHRHSRIHTNVWVRLFNMEEEFRYNRDVGISYWETARGTRRLV